MCVFLDTWEPALRRGGGKKRTRGALLLITRLFEAAASEAPGTFAPGAHGTWPCQAAAGPGASLTCSHQHTGAHLSERRPRQGAGLRRFRAPDLGVTARNHLGSAPPPCHGPQGQTKMLWSWGGRAFRILVDKQLEVPHCQASGLCSRPPGATFPREK